MWYPLPLLMMCGVYDYKNRIIPNYLNGLILLSGLIFQIIIGNIKLGILGFIVGFGFGLLLYLTKGFGAGDAKLMAGIGMWVGVENLFVILIFSVIVGFLWLIAVRIQKGVFLKKIRLFLQDLFLIKVKGIKNLFFRSNELIPFGSCLAVGYLIFSIGCVYQCLR